MNKAIRVLLADDQSLIRDGLRMVLELEPDITVAGTAQNGEEAVELAQCLHPDVAVLDIRMPRMDGVECTRRIKELMPDCKVLILTTFDDDIYLLDALANGASGYLLKDMEMEELVEAVRDAASGKMALPPAIAGRLSKSLAKASEAIKQQRPPAPPELQALSAREREIAAMLAQGFTTKQIASALFLSEGTSRNYISAIYAKLGVYDRSKAILRLKELGL
ncbi:response regulator transcription factor [Paenibacillus sp. YN15]|uniref:response regulator n=1 Tax=Paenibacillus sp. YN15 TaxID=1742774 RepID=UPI001C65761B|nr:response regulator transcription factor [Paenibacillus sp. YN15]